MANQTNTRLDETFFRQQYEHALHSNSILFYFAQSPFFDPTSKNALIFSQGISNHEMGRFLATREAFEEKVKERPGIEFVVAQEPAESGPGAGTGVWVINKQRRDEHNRVTILATYHVVGESIYQAPSFMDVMSSRMAAVSSSIAKIRPAAESVQKWTPAQGRVNKQPAEPAVFATAKAKTLDARDSSGGGSTPLPLTDGSTKPAAPGKEKAGGDSADFRVLEEAIRVHLRYGNEYMNENPITGRPGAFHLSTSGRKEQQQKAATLAPPKPAPGAAQGVGVGGGPGSLPALNTKVEAAGKNGKDTKSPKTPNMPKPKRRKSKMGGATTPS